MLNDNYDTASEAMNALKSQGYTIDFSVLVGKECLICDKTKRELSPDDFVIDYIFRFEGMTDPGDEIIVYAISSLKNEMKGIVVDAYGAYSDSMTNEIVKKLHKALK